MFLSPLDILPVYSKLLMLYTLTSPLIKDEKFNQSFPSSLSKNLGIGFIYILVLKKVPRTLGTLYLSIHKHL